MATCDCVDLLKYDYEKQLVLICISASPKSMTTQLSFPLIVLYERGSVQVGGLVNCCNTVKLLWWGVVSTSPNLQAGGPPLVRCLRLLRKIFGPRDKVTGEWRRLHNVDIFALYLTPNGARGGIMVKALLYKPAGHGFDSRWCHWDFPVT